MKTPHMSMLLLSAIALAFTTAATAGLSADVSPVDITATDHAFVMPAQIRGGVVRMRFRVTGKEPHEFAFGRIEGGHTLKEALAAIRSAKDVAWIHDLAGPPLLTPGATIDITRTLTRGRYFFLDFVPNRKGVSHVDLGLAREFNVTGSSGARLPSPDAVITARKNRFDVPPLHPGVITIELRNRSGAGRGFSLTSLRPGKTSADSERWIASVDKTGKLPADPIPFDAYGAIQTIPTGTSVYLTIALERNRSYRLADDDSGIATTFTPR